MSNIYLYQSSKSAGLLRVLKQYDIMADLSTISLKHFYIYNDTFGQIESEDEEKIMYYFPPKVSADNKMKNVGLSEAIIKFTETFSKNHPCESLHTEKTRHYYYKPEPNFYMVMVVNVPSRGGVEGRSYHGEEVQDSVCLAVLRQAYLMYRLFHNSFTSALDAAGRNTQPLMQTLEPFFNKYLANLNLQNCDIMDVFQGVRFLPLDKQAFLQIHCFINLLEASFPVVEYTAFLYNDRLIWSGLEPEDMQVVYHYLVYSLLPKNTETTPQLSTALNSYGRFLTGPENVHSNTNDVGKVPRVFLSHVKPVPATFHLVVYHSMNCTICLFIPESEQVTMEMFRKWDTFLGMRLSRLATDGGLRGQSPANRQSTSVPAEAAPRFVYFNRMNLATKSTIHLDGADQRTAVTPQVLRILADINADHTRSSESGNPCAETIMKTMTDHWVVGKLSNAREFYVVIQQKNVNLIEINEEVKRICDSELKNIFFHV